MTWRDSIVVHPAANLFPLLGKSELQQLADDIEAHGLHEKIKIIQKERRRSDGSYHVGEYDQVVIDGRNRLDALELAGFPIFQRSSTKLNLEFVDIVNELETDAEVVAYVIGANIRRRHLTGEQRRNITAELLRNDPERSNRATAEIAGVDDKTVASVRQQLEAIAEIPQLTKRTGKDGKARPATKPTASKRELVTERAMKAAAPKELRAVTTSAKVDRPIAPSTPVDRTLDERVDSILVHCALTDRADAIGTIEPETVAAGVVLPDDVRQMLDKVETIRDWLDRFVALLHDPARADAGKAAP